MPPIIAAGYEALFQVLRDALKSSTLRLTTFAGDPEPRSARCGSND